ncbi:botulinum neurotoxin subtype F7 [Clostridium baratii]|uniref:Botulinum neurotoxin type F n=1 Tax=Clostridium baratii TaxID=1561 RepID=D2KHT3_9CLOT|nr:botulinum neurotoxin subtype F7 [Clostridium baratii]ADA79583.1 botulinum neurotoxin type F [Clostridium baratii]AQM58565.1 peptidase M27 [Clostridium baratii]KJU72378.1 peptidase M27 [Clostridium baratii]
MPVNINNFNYNDPINNTTILYMKMPYYEDSNKYYKAFEIMDNVWIIPERNIIGKKPSDFYPPISLDSGSSAYYDPNYLTTDAEKDRFLKTVIKLFNRINSNPAGQVLLEEIKNGKPYLGNDHTAVNEFCANNRSTSVEIKESNGTTDSMLLNLVILGPGPNILECSTFPVRIFPNNIAYDPSEKGFGSIQLMSFSTEYEYAFNDNTDLFIADPAISLAHELIHVLHGLYGAKGVTNKKVIEVDQGALMAAEKDIKIEEFITFGGQDLNIVTNSTNQKIYDNLLSNYTAIASRLSQVNINNSALNTTYYKNFFQWKYGLDQDSNGNYTVNISKFNAIYKKLFSFTECDLAQKFQVKNRSNYLFHFKPFKLLDLLDDNIYSISEGFNIGSLRVNNNGQNINLNSRIVGPIPDNGLVERFVGLCKSIVSKKGTKNSLCIKVNNRDLFFVASESSYNENGINSPKEIDDTTITNNNYKKNLDEVILDYNSDAIPNLSSRLLNATAQNDSYVPKYDSNGTSEINEYTVDKLNVFFYLYAQKAPEGESAISLTSSVDTALLDASKVYTFFSSDFINTVNKPVQAALFISWIQQVINDFTTEATQKSTIDKIADISLVVPYVGLALNIGNEVQKGNFKEAIELLGAGILLEFVPELLIPTILVFTIKSFINSDDSKNKIIKAINNALRERELKWKEVYSWIVSNWLTRINTQFNKRKEQMYQALQNQVDGIKKIIEYKYNNYTLDEKNRLKAEYNIYNIKEELNKKVSLAMQNIDRFLTESSISYLMKLINEAKINKLSEYDKRVNQYLLNYILENSSTLGTSSVQELNNLVSNTLNNSIPFELSEYTNDKILISYFNRFYKRIIDSSILNMKYENNRFIDSSGYGSNISINGDIYIYSTNRNQFGIYSSRLSEVNITQNNTIIYNSRYQNFSVSFWVRIPKYNNLKNLNNEYTIINCMRNNNSGWKISLNYNNIIWTLQDTTGNNQKLVFNYTQMIDISDYINKWTFVTITNNRLGHSKLYINGNLTDQKSISNLGNIHVDDNILFKIVGCNDTRYVGIRYFKIFNMELDKTEIETLYHSEPDSTILKDFWGNYLLYNKKYYLLNLLKPNMSVTKNSDILNINRQRGIYSKTNIFSNARLYTGVEVIIRKFGSTDTSNTDNFVRKNDTVYISVVDGNSEYQLYADVSTSAVEKTIKLRRISNSNYNSNQMIIMDSIGDNCTMNFKTNNGNDIGLLGFHLNNLVASSWYYKNIRNNTRNNGCFWSFISKEHGWQE